MTRKIRCFGRGNKGSIHEWLRFSTRLSGGVWLGHLDLNLSLGLSQSKISGIGNDVVTKHESHVLVVPKYSIHYHNLGRRDLLEGGSIVHQMILGSSDSLIDNDTSVSVEDPIPDDHLVDGLRMERMKGWGEGRDSRSSQLHTQPQGRRRVAWRSNWRAEMNWLSLCPFPFHHLQGKHQPWGRNRRQRGQPLPTLMRSRLLDDWEG